MGAMVIVVLHEVLAQFLQFAVVLDKERFQDTEFTVIAHLAAHEPVDERVRIKGNDNRFVRLQIAVGATVIGDATFIIEGFQLEHGVIRCRIEVHRLAHTAIETVEGDTHTDAHDGRHEGKKRQFTLHALDELRPQYGEVRDAGVFTV